MTKAFSMFGRNMFGMSFVERYLYSLPEYRLELQRRNYIEIYSYNGLMATRKVIGTDTGSHWSGFLCGVIDVRSLFVFLWEPEPSSDREVVFWYEQSINMRLPAKVKGFSFFFRRWSFIVKIENILLEKSYSHWYHLLLALDLSHFLNNNNSTQTGIQLCLFALF